MTYLPMEPDPEFFPLHRPVVYDGRLCTVTARNLIAGRPLGRYAYQVTDLAGQTTAALGADLRAPTDDDRTFLAIVAAETSVLMPRIVLVDDVYDGDMCVEHVQIVECVLPPAGPDSFPERGFLWQAVVGHPDLRPARTLPDGRREQGNARGGHLVATSTSSAEHALAVARRLLTRQVR